LALQDVAAHRADVLAELDHLLQEAKAAWERSKIASVEEAAARRASAGGDFSTASIKRRQRDGNVAYLREARECVKLQGQIFGLYQRDDLKDRGDQPAVKLVAGIDPIELV
jgi:hypothetical protein